MGCIISSSFAADSAAGDADDVEIPPHREKYDVFISFRGEDTRRGITSHLHQALEQRKIETYIDYRLQRGEEIGPALVEAIERSRISVIIFSKNYPSSTWCLKELVHILKCKERYGQMVIPVFYDISPSDIRNQQGSYAVAFARLEKRFKDSIDKVREWRNALTTAANLSGFDYSNNPWTEADLIKNVVNDIWNKLIRESSCDFKGLFGIERHIEQIESLLCIHSPEACITVGIWGMGGIGKTTIAETVFHKLSSTFEASCFLRNVRENSEQTDGLDRLEKKILKEILKKEDLSIGSTFVRESLSRTRVLIVFDDVSDSMQMEHLAGNRLRYGTGSRIIITSRDRRTLRPSGEEDKIYEVEGLKPDDALQLFYSRAFMNNITPKTDYKELAEKAVDYSRGIPLALVLLGSSFLNCQSKEEWEEELNKLKELPSENIQKVLRLSYDALGGNEKEIFLDIACFHKGKNVDEVKRMLDIREFHAAPGIRVLVYMSLISIDSTWKIIRMHDLVQEMGRTIASKQCIEDPGKRSRLFKNKDVNRVLQNNTGTPIVQAMWVDGSKIENQTLKRADFKVMSNLMMLTIVNSGTYRKFTASLDLPSSLRYLNWEGYPLKSLPSKFSPENLVELHMPRSAVKKLWNEDQRLVNLKVINLKYSKYLMEVPNLSGSPKIEHIDLYMCKKLSVVPGSIYSLTNLKTLSFRDCPVLKELPSGSVRLQSLEVLDLSCTSISEIPDGLVGSTSLQKLDLSGSMIRSIPASIKQASRLHTLSLSWCNQLQSLPELPVQCDLEAHSCRSLKTVPSSRTALTQGWDKYTYFGKRNFFNCGNLDDNARSNIMDEAQLRIMREATNSSKKDYGIVCPGKEIPKWFSFRYQSEGSSVHIKLPPDCFRTGLLGFVLSAVVSCVSNFNYVFEITARCNVKSLGESHGLFTSGFRFMAPWVKVNQHDHVCVWGRPFIIEEGAEECSPDVYKLANEASVQFSVSGRDSWSPDPSPKVEKCGIWPLYAEDVEKVKPDRVFTSGEPKTQEETREDETWEASGSSYKNKANESDDESEASKSSDEPQLYDSGNDSEASE
ncbi:unnamed protein product [Malus baccata var. baccata]